MRFRGLLLACLALLSSPPAQAGVDTTIAGPCTVRGTVVADMPIFDAAQGGTLVVTLTGKTRWLQLSEFGPTRVRARSGTDAPSLRIDGFADWSAVSIVSPHNISVAPPLLSIRATVPLRLVEAGSTLTASPRDPSFRDVSGAVSCGDLVAGKSTWPPAAAPGGAPKVVTSKSFALYAKPDGAPALTLEFVTPSPQTFLQAYESQGDFVHVRYVGDVFVDGWCKKSLLSEPPAIGLGNIGTFGTGTGWGSNGSKWYAQRDTEVRLGPSAQAPLVGTLEKGARIVYWGGKANKDGWSELRVFSGDVREPPGKAFFVREKDIGGKQP